MSLVGLTACPTRDLDQVRCADGKCPCQAPKARLRNRDKLCLCKHVMLHVCVYIYIHMYIYTYLHSYTYTYHICIYIGFRVRVNSTSPK